MDFANLSNGLYGYNNSSYNYRNNTYAYANRSKNYSSISNAMDYAFNPAKYNKRKNALVKAVRWGLSEGISNENPYLRYFSPKMQKYYDSISNDLVKINKRIEENCDIDKAFSEACDLINRSPED